MSLFFRRTRGIIITNTVPLLSSIRSSLSSSPAYFLSTGSVLTGPPPAPPRKIIYLRKAVRAALFQENDLRTVVDKFKSFCRYSWVRKDRRYYTYCARKLAAAKQFSWIEEIVEDQKKYRSIRKEKFLSTLMRVYMIAEMWDHARNLFNEMRKLKCRRGPNTCNRLFLMSVTLDGFTDVEKIFRGIFRKYKVKPDLTSYHSLLEAYIKSGTWEPWRELLDEMEMNRVDPNNTTFDHIVSMLFRRGQIEEGTNVMRMMMQKWDLVPSALNFEAKIKALVAQKNMAEALLTYQDLRLFFLKGVKPSVNTFTIIINAYCEAGDLLEAKKWYRELFNSWNEPNGCTFKRLIPFAYQMGDFWYAFKLCTKTVEVGCDQGKDFYQLVVNAVVRQGWDKCVPEFVERVDIRFGYLLKYQSNPINEEV